MNKFYLLGVINALLSVMFLMQSAPVNNKAIILNEERSTLLKDTLPNVDAKTFYLNVTKKQDSIRREIQSIINVHNKNLDYSKRIANTLLGH